MQGPARKSHGQLEAHKAVARAAIRAIEQGDLRALNELYEPNCLVHTSRGLQTEQGPYTNLKDACPLCAVINPRKAKIDVVVAEGDLVTVRWTLSGRNVGELRGAPPTGKDVSVIYTNIFRIDHGRIAENWVSVNQFSLLEQVGFTLNPPSPSE